MVPSPVLLRMGTEIVALGIPLQAVLDIAAELRSDARRTAGRFIDLFRRHVWRRSSRRRCRQNGCPR